MSINADSDRDGRLDRRAFLTRAGMVTAGASLAPLLAACGSASAPSVDKLSWAMANPLQTLDFVHEFDYASEEADSLGLEALMRYKADGTLEPALAQSFSQPDPLTYVYDLRPNVKFWDGSPLTPEDVVFSMSQHLNKKVASLFATFYTDVKDIRKTGDHQVTIALTRPVPYFKYIPAWQSGFIVSKAFAEAHGHHIGSSQVLTMGTGPYRFTSFKPATSLTAVRNEHYWGPKPSVRKVDISFISDPATLFLAVRSGQVDGTFDVPLQDLREWKQDNSIDLLYTAASQEPYFVFNSDVHPWNDIHVRRACAYALDRQGIISALVKGHGQPATTVIPPNLWAGLITPSQIRNLYASIPSLPFDLAKAKAELAQSSVPHGFTDTITLAQGFPITGQVSQVLSQSLRKIGITLNVKETNTNQWVADFYSHKPGINCSQFTGDYPDPAEFLTTTLDGSQAVPNGLNAANYRNSEVDRLVTVQNEAQHIAARVRAIQKILQIAARDLPYLPVIWQDAAIALSKRLRYEGLGPWFYDQPWAANIKSA